MLASLKYLIESELFLENPDSFFDLFDFLGIRNALFELHPEGKKFQRFAVFLTVCFHY